MNVLNTPWRVEDNPDFPVSPNSKSKYVIDSQAFEVFRGTLSECEAVCCAVNAYEPLLAACKAALVQSGCDGDLCNYAWHEQARAAIALAEAPNG